MAAEYQTWAHVFFNSAPQHVLIGDGAAAEVGPILLQLGKSGGKVALVVDRDVARLGLAERTQRSLADAGFEVETYSEIHGEPDEEAAETVVGWVRRLPLTAVVGLGGGSALDLAKLAAALAVNEGRIRDYIGQGKVRRPPLPSVLVPTTAGTGSEATRNAIVSIDGYKAVISSALLEPTVAVLDPTLTITLPPGVTAATGMDALTHAVEPYMSTFSNALTETAGLRAMRLISGAIRRAYQQPDDIEARREMLFGAFLSGIALNASTLLGHSIAYTIANRTHLPHGVTCAMALPYCLSYNVTAARERIAEAAQAITGASAAGARDLVAWVAETNQELSIPRSLRDVGIAHADLAAMAAECVARYPRPNNPEPLRVDRLERLYEFMWSGDPMASLVWCEAH